MNKTTNQNIELSTIHFSQNIVHDYVIDITFLQEQREELITKVNEIDTQIGKKHRAIYQEIAELGRSTN